MAYEHFYRFYDKLMSDVNYQVYVNIVRKYAKKSDAILDIACGTGNVLIELLKEDYQVCGLDISDEMLLVCQEKLANLNLQTTLFQDDMRSFQIVNYYDMIISFLDSLNYLTSIKDLKKTFSNVHNALNDGGYFIFDIHSLKNVNLVFSDYHYHEVNDDYTFIWDACVEKNNDFSTIFHELNFFIKINNGLYQKAVEYHKQVVYPLDVYLDLLKEMGFTIEETIENEYHKFVIVAKKCST